LVARRAGGPALVYAASAVLCGLLALVGAAVLLGASAPAALTLPLGLPWLGAHLRIDALAAVFLLLLGIGGAAASVFAIGYARHDPEPERTLPFFPGFLGAMGTVVLADDAFTFLLAWEVMSLLSWAMVLAHHRSGDSRRAGVLYLMMASLGTMVLLLTFGLMAGPDGDYAFAAMRAGDRGALLAGLILLLALIGTGSKAGLVPLHVWLPLAHPAAPSHVSALMSGVMTKVAVYGFVRLAFDLAGPAPWWAGMVVMLLGGATAVMGVVQALMQHDLKRLLAFHTVENIGIIFIGLGLALAFRADGLAAGAALALTAALFHALNHSWFKSLLFMGSGALLNATGSRDMEAMGGLIHRMPVTAVLFLVGSVAISALPPFNGFVSEWLTFQSILVSPALSEWALRITAPGVGGMLALAAALAAACFVKVFGVVFLGRPRSAAAAAAEEVDRASLAAMAALAALCLAAGVLGGQVIDLLRPASRLLTGEVLPLQSADPWLTVTPIASARSSYNGLLVLVFVALSASLAAWLVHRLASRELRRGPAWDCGHPDDDPATQYTAASFAQPIRRVFGSALLGAREEVEMPPPGDPRPARLRVRLRDPLWELGYVPVIRAVEIASMRLNALQFLTIRRYLALVFVALILLLVGVPIWG
ncbi:MAG: hydrogenase 4 subunit B, partial [Alphaproteobacteria bacterium]